MSKGKIDDYVYNEKKILDIEFELVKKYVSIRKDKKITQEELAKCTKVIRTTIARIEKNINSPQIKTFLQLLEPLGYTLEIVAIEK